MKPWRFYIRKSSKVFGISTKSAKLASYSSHPLQANSNDKRRMIWQCSKAHRIKITFSQIINCTHIVNNSLAEVAQRQSLKKGADEEQAELNYLKVVCAHDHLKSHEANEQRTAHVIHKKRRGEGFLQVLATFNQLAVLNHDRSQLISLSQINSPQLNSHYFQVQTQLRYHGTEEQVHCKARDNCSKSSPTLQNVNENIPGQGYFRIEWEEH